MLETCDDTSPHPNRWCIYLFCSRNVTLDSCISFRKIGITVKRNPRRSSPLALEIHCTPHSAINSHEFGSPIALTSNNSWFFWRCNLVFLWRLFSETTRHCVVTSFQHTDFAVFQTCPTAADEDCAIIAGPLAPKTLPEQRACTIYNISEAHPNRFSSEKDILILLLTFFVDTHGSI